MGIPVKLEAFEGPLDLLLHLIEKNKIDPDRGDHRTVYGIYPTDAGRKPEYHE